MSNDAATTTLQWAQVDVFAERALEGNMLAVFPDATGLSDSEMQALARETNLSETTFIFPAHIETERERGVRVRIFTVDEELPFAGHPTLGTASWVWMNHPLLRGADEIRLLLNVGTIPVRFRSPQASEDGVHAEMRQRDPEFGRVVDAAAIAQACGLNESDLHPSLPPQVVNTGLPFCMLPLNSIDALQRLRIDQTLLKPLLEATGAKLVYAITPSGQLGEWRARMPFNGSDDPATGSAAGCAVSYLVKQSAVGSNETITILQGEEVRRPSRLTVRATKTGDRVHDVFVGGRTIPVANGVFRRP